MPEKVRKGGIRRCTHPPSHPLSKAVSSSACLRSRSALDESRGSTIRLVREKLLPHLLSQPKHVGDLTSKCRVGSVAGRCYCQTVFEDDGAPQAAV